MTKQRIKFLSDKALDYLKTNPKFITEQLRNNPTSSEWLSTCIDGDVFIAKKFYVDTFNLKLPKFDKDRNTEFENAKTIYESFKVLPSYVLCDERFWGWVNFEIGYEVALKYMPIKENISTFKDHWLFTQGNRRGLMFGVLSRCYYRVALTVDQSLDDPYELTKFVFENPERFRNLTWRSYSSEQHIVRGALKGEKRVIDELGPLEEKNGYYTEIAKAISREGSVKLLDCMTEGDIEDLVYRTYIEILDKDIR